MYYRDSSKLHKSGQFMTVNCPLTKEQFDRMQAIGENYETGGLSKEDALWNNHRRRYERSWDGTL